MATVRRNTGKDNGKAFEVSRVLDRRAKTTTLCSLFTLGYSEQRRYHALCMRIRLDMLKKGLLTQDEVDKMKERHHQSW